MKWYVIQFGDGTYYKDNGRTRDKYEALKFAEQKRYGVLTKDDARQLIGVMADRSAKIVPAPY